MAENLEEGAEEIVVDAEVEEEPDDYTIEDYFEALELLSIMEAAGMSMGEGIKCMIESYNHMQETHQPLTMLQDAHDIIQWSINDLYEFWTGVDLFRNALNYVIQDLE